ncbi:molybdate ABC transporter substrate-binding protein [Brumicola blandensis]|uniref:Molybdate ABC transporter substrate-binding protein n=1 Tax=Brumicola blandensis TaxID=3075611 RepID=A0AAW8QX18_9ALTE|nr:molybdate ABC transporter substrate-binding protein [Alteromonas sp. W409]MDT0581180.1 molybdate ABC transporter substrate-binding protein [Alteromonas sp. W409]
MTQRRILLFSLAMLLLSALPSVYAANEESLHIAVASNFIAPMQDLQKAFETLHNVSLTVSYASSGKLYAQIVNGAPYDVFLSADQTKPTLLTNNKYAIHSSQFTYAHGELILWSGRENLWSAGKILTHSDQTHNLASLFNSLQVKRFSMANPKFAPYGLAAQKLLQNTYGTQKPPATKVQGESISQAFQFVASGNVDIGFIARSQLPDYGSFWLLAEEDNPAINQDAVILSASKQFATASAFIEFLQSKEAKNIIQSHGYRTE